MKVLKKSGYFAHVLNQGWAPKVGVYADTPTELLCAFRGKVWQLLGLGPRYGITFVLPSSNTMAAIGKLMAEGKLKAVIDRVLPLEEARAAHEYLEKGHARGKVVLTMSS